MNTGQDDPYAADPYRDIPAPEYAPWETPTLRAVPNGAVVTPTPSTWEPEDLTAFIDGDPDPVQPTLWEREDHLLLLYPARVHAILGETESGKSFVMHALIADLLRRGGRVCLIDYESVATTVVPRIKSMGVSGQQIADCLSYIRPETSPFATNPDQTAWNQLCAGQFDLIVLDGVNEALATMSLSMIDNDEVTHWQRTVPRKLAETTGAPVVLIDHVTKSTENRGRFAIGAQAKLAALGGVGYTLEVVQPLGKGLRGELLMWIGKDREGVVRPHQVDYNAKTRMGKIATIIVDSTQPRVYVTVHPPRRDGEQVTTVADKLPKLAPLMEAVSEALIESAAAGNVEPKKTALLEKVRGNKGDKDDAFAMLEREGHLVCRTEGRSIHVRLARPYWRAEARLEQQRRPPEVDDGEADETPLPGLD